MKKSPTFLFLFFLLALTNCKKESTFQLTVNNQSDSVNEISLANILLGVDTTLIASESNVFNLDLELQGPTLIDVTVGNDVFPIYADGGVTTLFSIEASGMINIPEGDLNNQALKEFSEMSNKIAMTLNPTDYFSEPLERFKIKMDERFQSLDSFVMAHKSGDVHAYLKNSVAALKSSDASIYPNYYNYIKKDSIEFPESFTSNTYGLSLEDENMLLTDATRTSLTTLAGKMIELHDGITMDEFIKKFIAYANENIENPNTRNYLIFKQLLDRINYGGGIDGIEEELESLLANTDNAYYHKKMNALKAEWANLRAGQNAPGFNAYDRDGNPVALEDLKGKAVYIDVWATWCGPCIAEIPSLKSIEKDYHDADISFVSVSIDQQSDEEKWKNFVKEKQLGGLQLMAENAWQSDIASGYNIKGIPRFILIDKDGKIVRADAPRPSSNEIRNLLDNYKG